MIEGQEGVTWEQWQAIARACEEHGIGTLFRSDHYMSLEGAHAERGALDAWATLAGLATVTDRLRLGTLVSPATFRHPNVLANAAATVDQISGGRVELGMGGGWNVPEHEAFGIPFPEVAERMALLLEQIEIVHRLWTEDDVDIVGLHYRLQNAPGLPKPVQKPHPPLLVGGTGAAEPRSLPPAGPTSTTRISYRPRSSRSAAARCGRRASAKAATRTRCASR